VSGLLTALDERSKSGDIKNNAAKLTEIEQMATACVRLLEAQSASAEVFIQLAERAIKANDYDHLDKLADRLGERFLVSEIAEIIRCRVDPQLKDCGITLIDGPFFSVMPFGNTGFHTLTAVTFTPHKTCYSNLPRFNCQQANPACMPETLQNCNNCPARPQTSFPYMWQLAKKYLHQRYSISYDSSLFAIKPILLASEIDDSRPTLIRSFSKEPGYISVLSGKINTIYDMENVIA
jgi:hypothetical protein